MTGPSPVALSFSWAGSFMIISGLTGGETIAIKFPLVESVETHYRGGLHRPPRAIGGMMMGVQRQAEPCWIVVCDWPGCGELYRWDGESIMHAHSEDEARDWLNSHDSWYKLPTGVFCSEHHCEAANFHELTEALKHRPDGTCGHCEEQVEAETLCKECAEALACLRKGWDDAQRV